MAQGDCLGSSLLLSVSSLLHWLCTCTYCIPNWCISVLLGWWQETLPSRNACLCAVAFNNNIWISSLAALRAGINTTPSYTSEKLRERECVTRERGCSLLGGRGKGRQAVERAALPLPSSHAHWAPTSPGPGAHCCPCATRRPLGTYWHPWAPLPKHCSQVTNIPSASVSPQTSHLTVVRSHQLQLPPTGDAPLPSSQPSSTDNPCRHHHQPALRAT